MKIILIGYGKMGKTIEKIIEKQQKNEVIARFDVSNHSEITEEILKKADVAIEFTQPETAFDNIARCIRAGLPVVSGTTGWLEKMEEAKSLCETHNGSFFYASNYSIGVNIFFAVNRYLSEMMAAQPQYEVEMEEIHHTQKLDYPSGTAITLAQGILEKVKRKTSWAAHLEGVGEVPPAFTDQQIPLISKRKDPAPGTHSITWNSPIDAIEIKHTAHSREGFAAGALAAAEWLVDKKGVFGMKDMLGF